MFHVLHLNLVSLLSKISAGWVTQILGISTYLCLGTCGGGVALPVVLKIGSFLVLPAPIYYILVVN